ncbi:hypothetical protein [Bradyrhizobium zhanjiangense]|uniref:hypothetical protein n=1 Tax=Bradyrhizobium zhanjiangense TaxID=1325107 RepID=UPI0010086EBD|nr:hypothetical protein [Bradyrhizobium zhanjiangense]
MKPTCKFALVLSVGAPFLVGIDDSAWAQSRLTVNRDDPALVQFRQQPAAAAPTGAATLEIPVLGLLAAPGAPAPAAPPLLVTDPARDAGWYNLIYERGNVKITINGDLSYQNLPAAAQLPSAPAEQYTVASADDLSEPVSAQVVLYRFPNIPYVIDVYCKTAAVYEQCRSEQQLRALISSVGLLSAPQ